jgi:hypothetical protein
MEPNLSLKQNSRIIGISAFGLADGRIEMHIQDGIAPYRLELKINDTAPITDWALTPPWRTIENIPAASSATENNCIIDNLPPGNYKFRIYDSGDPSIANPANGGQQMNVAFTDWNAAGPPFSTLNGSVNPLGIPTTVSFEFGETEEYGHEAQAGVVNGSVSVNVTLKLSAGDYNAVSVLKPGTLYHYRIKATNANGTTRGSDMTFTTPVTLPIAVTLPATNIR